VENADASDKQHSSIIAVETTGAGGKRAFFIGIIIINEQLGFEQLSTSHKRQTPTPMMNDL
jgi:hypothetical protein